MTYSDTQRLNLLDELIESGANIGKGIELPNGETVTGPNIRAQLDEILSNDPGEARIPEPIDEVRRMAPDADCLAVRSEVWAAPYEANSKWTIAMQAHADDEDFHHFYGPTYNEARARFAQHLAKTPIQFPK
jgi:hypothetical protein